MATSSQKEVFVYVPERKQNRVKKRFSKRQTTLRSFTFVKDWQSPVVEVSHGSQKKDTSKKNKEPVLNVASVVSSSSSLPDPDINPVVASPASLSRVSPSPLLIPNQSPRARVFASSSSQQIDSSSNSSATNFRTPQSPLASPTHSQSSIKKKSSATSQSTISLQSSTRAQSSNHSRSSRSVSSSKRTAARGSSQFEQEDDSSEDNNSLTRANTKQKGGDHTLVEKEGEAEVANDQLAASNNQLEVVDEQSDPIDDEADGINNQSESDESVRNERKQQEDNRRETLSPALQSASSQRLLKTPAEKSLSIIHQTPLSGPANRIAAKRRRPSPIPKKGGKQARKPQTKPTLSSAGSKAKVRLWIGGGRHRTAIDTTDLDIILAKTENISSQYKHNLASRYECKAITRFYQYVEKDLTDKIDLAQEYKKLKSSLSRMNISTRKQRKQLLALQQQNARLDMQIAQMKKQASSKQEKDKSLSNISTFLTDLQNLQKEYANTKPQGSNQEYHVTPDNLDMVLSEVKAQSQSRHELRRLNNQLQDWLDTN